MPTILDAFLAAYIEAALWSSNDESTPDGGEPMDANYCVEDIAPETLAAMRAECEDFITKARQLIEDDDPTFGPDCHSRWERAGHDFWLNRNGHGCGFWDGDWPKHGDELDKFASAAGERYLYVGDDGKVHQDPIHMPGEK